MKIGTTISKLTTILVIRPIKRIRLALWILSLRWKLGRKRVR